MKICYTTLGVQDKTLEQAVRLAENWKLEGIELRGKKGVHISSEDSPEYVESAKRLIKEAGLSIPCLTAYTKFYQPSAEEACEQARKLIPMIRLAEYIGAFNVRTFMGEIPQGMEREQADEIARAGLLLVAELMGDSPVRVVIETHDSVKDGKTLKKLLRGIPSKIGVLLDIIHPWDMGESIEQTWELIGDKIYHVHIKDIQRTVLKGRVYCKIGEGLLPVEDTVKFLLAKRYDGFFSLEWETSAEGYSGVTLEEQMESFLKFRKQIGESI